MALTSVATFFSAWVLLMHGSAFADSVCSVAETDEDLSSAIQTKVTKETHASQEKDATYRNLFTITMPKDKRMISIDGANTNFRDWIADELLPLAATKAKKFYSCERGDSMTFYMEFADRNQGDAFLNIFAWKPCTYFQAVKDSESTFAGLDNGGTKWQAELTEHAFDMGISCGDCKLIAPVQPSVSVKVCTAEQVQAIIAASKPPAYAKGSKDSLDECPQGTSVIRSRSACIEAAAKLGLEFRGDMSNPLHYPAGCIYAATIPHAYFNDLPAEKKGAAISANIGPVCG